MEPLEIIDLSSDEEKSPPKKLVTPTKVLNSAKREINLEDVKKDVNNRSNGDDLKIVYNVVRQQKRPLNNADEGSAKKKMKSLEDKNCPEIGTDLVNKKTAISLHKISKIRPITLAPRSLLRLQKSETITANDHKDSLKLTINGNSEQKLKSPDDKYQKYYFKVNEGASSSKQSTIPQLLVKDKIKMSETSKSNVNPSEEVLQAFIDACQYQDSSSDMQKIIAKLKKRYNNLYPCYAKSGSFIELIRGKTALIRNNSSKIFLHISEVMNEMKARQIEKRKKNMDTRKDNDDVTEENSMQEEELTIADSKEKAQILALEKAMRRCERRILKCEMAEVDFDDENDSHYIMAEKFKHRMVELFNKYCEITGEKRDAGRAYLRPKQFHVTPIQPLNDAITSFINMKITKMNKSAVYSKKKTGQLLATDTLIFPDYVDILNCIVKCNDEHDLKLSKIRQESIAKTAFEDLGQVLQRYRKQDYWETFSLYLDKEDCDPALDDDSLAKKLADNETLGKKNLDQVFQEFVEKQYAAKSAENLADSETAEDQDTDKRSSQGSEDEESEASTESMDMHEVSDSPECETDVIIKKPLDRLLPKNDIDIEPKKRTRENVEAMENKQCENNEDLPHVETTAKNNIESDDNPVTENKVTVEVPTATEKKITPPAPLQQDEIECVAIVRPRISEKNNDLADPSKMSSNVIVDTAKKTLLLNSVPKLPSTVKTKPNAVVNTTAVPSAIRKITSIHLGIDTRSDSAKTTPLQSLIKKPTSAATDCDMNLVRAVVTPNLPETERDSSNTTAVDGKAIEARAVAPTIELSDEEEEKKPTLRLKQFAKLPGSWKDLQSPTRSVIAESKTIAAADRVTEKKKMNVDNEQQRLTKLNKGTPVGRTIRVRNDILTNWKNKSSTIIIPKNAHGSSSQINVNTVTTNVTLNLTNPSQFQPKLRSIVSCGTKPDQSVIDIDKKRNIINRANVESISIGNNKGKVCQKSNTIQKVPSNGQQIFMIKNPSNQVCQVGQQTPGITGQQRIKIISQTNGSDQQQTIVHDVPVIMESGKRTIYKIVSRSPKAAPRSVILQPAKAALAQNRTSQSNNQGVNCKSPIVNDSSSVLSVPTVKSIKKTLSFKIAQKTPSTVVSNAYGKPLNGVSTYALE